MSKQDLNKDKELKRLAGEVFEGCPDWLNAAAMDKNGQWFWWVRMPITSIDRWVCGLPDSMRCQNQPETDLPWTETLIRRSDYE